MFEGKMNLIATAAFGLEGVVSRELEWLGVEDKMAENGRVRYTGDMETVAQTNMWLRCADRVLISLAEGEVKVFEDLFQLVKSVPFETFMPENAKINVTGKSVKSVLHSVPDCQAITKKAIIERLRTFYNIDWFPEDGPVFRIEVSVLNDRALITLDTSGAGLHKRGYRKEAAKAPIKETLAAGMILISHWHSDRALIDPFCGSGTIPIEAAMIAKNIAPGLKREFDFEKWDPEYALISEKVRSQASRLIKNDVKPIISGSDINYFAIKQAKENAALAGVSDCITFQKLDFRSVSSHYKYGSVISNPPYGQRLGDEKETAELYKEMGKYFKTFDTWSKYFITSCDTFERLYGAPAGKKRKLYNGMLKCNLYQYFGPKPMNRGSSNEES